MKQETGKKNNKWLLPVIIAAVLVIAAVVACIFLIGGGETQQTEQPTEPVAVTGEIYWNLNRKDNIDPETGLSVRMPGEDGLYHILFAYKGEQVELTVNDKKLVNRIDMADHMALEVDANGSITNVHATAEVANVAAENFFVQKFEGNTLMVNSSQALNGMEVPFQITENTGIYNVSALAEKPGAVDTVEPMDKVVVLQTKEGETTHVFIVERMIASDLYWRVEQYYNSTKKITTRVPDAAGVYTIRFAVNGQQVDLKCKDVEVVSYIDSLANNVQCTGLTFDEQGFITGTVTPANAIRGALVSNQFDVTELTETGFSTTRMLPSSNQGSTWSGNFAADCKFYDVTGVSGFIGIEVDSLKMNDRVYVLTNAMGEAQVVFITNRMVDAGLYWMVTARSFNTTTMVTTQKPDESGYYVMEFIHNGKLVTLKTKDVEIANAVHKQNPSLMGLDVEKGIITKVYHYVNVTGGWAATSGGTVASISGPVVTVGSSGSTTSLVLHSECKVTNAFMYVEKGFGSYTELALGDQIYAIRNAAGEIIEIFITGRPVKGAKVYWSVTRKWANNQSTRTPMPEGHEFAGMYEFLVTGDGKKPVKLYAENKTLADHIDRQYPQSVGLKVEGSVIKAVVPAECVTGGYDMANYCHAEYWINEGYEFYALYRATGNGTKVKYNRETIIYNVSAGASYIGVQEKDIKLNDRIHVITDTSGTAKYIYIVEQEVAGDPYYTISSTGPDAEGTYTFKMVHKGKVVELTTKDKEVAAEVRSYTIGMGLHVKGNTITRAFAISSLANYGGSTAANYDVVKINGNKLTMNRTRPSASNQGHEMEVDITGVKLYDVSYGSTNYGAVVKPKIGDRIVFYLNNDGTAPAIGFVTIRCNREGGAFGKCDHCGKTVYWNPWEGNFPANANLEKDNTATHYYMNYNVNLTTQQLVGNANETLMASVLDLNGKTIKSTGRALGAWYNATLYVLDSSKAQTGTVIGTGHPTEKGDGAGVAMTTRGGNIVINGGTWRVADEHNKITDGGILNGFGHKDFKAGAITINGGTFYGTDVTGNGSVIASNAPEIIINGGEFFGGSAGNIGGTLACPTSKMTINGGIIHGGIANYGATISCPNLTINGGTIEAGQAVMNGDCMYVSSSFNLKLNGGKVAEITTTSTWTGSLTVTGKPEIGNLIVAAGKMVDLTGVTGGSIGVTASGAFTTAFASDEAAQKVADLMTSMDPRAELVVKNKQIHADINRCLFGHTAADHEAGVECLIPEILNWKLWTSTTSLPTATGNYILTGNVTTGNQTSLVGSDVVIDLDGHDITYKIPAPRTEGFRVFYLNDSKNSNGKTEGATPSSLIITDNSSDDPELQGTITAINPEYAPSAGNITAWTNEGTAKAETEIAAAAESLQAEAKELALLKGEEGSGEYKAEYEAQLAALTEEKLQTLIDEYIAAKTAQMKGYHDAAEYGMIAALGHGNMAILGGNLDASGLTTDRAGVAIYVNAKGANYHEESQNLVIMGGTISGGTTTKSGAAIYAGAGAKLNMTDGVINGGTITAGGNHGAAIYATGASTVTVVGGTINGGLAENAQSNSGSIYMDGTGGVVTIGGTAVVNAGKAGNGDSMYMRFGTWYIGGNATINGGLYYSGNVAANLTISGAPKILMQEEGSAYALKYYLYNNKVKFENLTEGAEIVMSSGGTLSQAGDAAQIQSWIDAGYFVNGTGAGTIGVADNALTIGEFYCAYGHTSHEGIDCAEPIVAWQKWTSTTTLPITNGNYYIPEGSELTLTTQTIYADTTKVLDVKLDLRGSTIKYTNANNRMLLIKGAAGSQYVITSTTEAKGVMKTTAATMGSSGNGMIYANIGTIRLININVDTTSITENATYSSIAHILASGIFQAENCVLNGGKSSSDVAIYQTPSGDANSDKPVNLVLKDTTVYGGVHIQGSGAKTKLEGTVKLLPNAYNNFGIKGSAELAEIVCANLAEGSELVASNLNYSFATEDAAADANGVIIKAAEGKKITVSGKKLTVADDVNRCIYGHESHEGVDCDEEIVSWTKLQSTIKALPTTPGNYYFADNSTVNLETQVNTGTDSGTIRIDLRGSTINQTKVNLRIMLVHGSANVTFCDTKGNGKLANIAASMGNAASGSVLYAHTGTLNIFGKITVDASGVAEVTATDQNGGALYVHKKGILNVDGATIKGNDKVPTAAICNIGIANLKNMTVIATATGTNPEVSNSSWESSIGTMTIENCTIPGYVYNSNLLTVKDSEIGELQHNATGTNLTLTGVVKIGLMRTNHENCTINCNGLVAGSELIVSKGIYQFDSSPVFNAALDAGVIKAAEGFKFASETGAERKVVAVDAV